MIRTAAIALGITFACSAALADDGDRSDRTTDQRPREWITRDRDGRQTGRIEEKPYGSAVYDRNGDRQGWIEEKANGDRVQYDRSGRHVGTIERR